MRYEKKGNLFLFCVQNEKRKHFTLAFFFCVLFFSVSSLNHAFLLAAVLALDSGDIRAGLPTVVAHAIATVVRHVVARAQTACAVVVVVAIARSSTRRE